MGKAEKFSRRLEAGAAQRRRDVTTARLEAQIRWWQAIAAVLIHRSGEEVTTVTQDEIIRLANHRLNFETSQVENLCRLRLVRGPLDS